MSFAENEFFLSELIDGASRRKILISVQRQTGIIPKELTPVPCPESLMHVWIWFLELNKGRGNNGFGELPLAYTEMLAWSQLTDQQPSPYEVSAIRAVDSAYMQSIANQQKKNKK